jgi:hypothetical protein
MPKQKIELTTEQKNITKRFLLCYNPTCSKDDGQTAVATRLCPFCYKIGYCCLQCINKDITRHYETDCQQNMVENTQTKQQTSKTTKQTKSSNDNTLNTNISATNINEYLSDDSNSSISVDTDEDKHKSSRKHKKNINNTTNATNVKRKNK